MLTGVEVVAAVHTPDVTTLIYVIFWKVAGGE
jgi:hypothetical protein